MGSHKNPMGKFHIQKHVLVQKYDGSENIENPSRALEVTLGSTRLVEFKTHMWEFLGIFELHFPRK